MYIYMFTFYFKYPPFFGYDVDPLLKKGCIHRGKPAFSNNTLKKGRVFGVRGIYIYICVLKYTLTLDKLAMAQP